VILNETMKYVEIVRTLVLISIVYLGSYDAAGCALTNYEVWLVIRQWSWVLDL